MFWLACHNSVPTLSLLNHRNLAQSAICTRCGFQNETFLHCVRDRNQSRILWQQVGFTRSNFFSNENTHDWLKNGSLGPLSRLFVATLWWVWRTMNMTCLGNENWSTTCLTLDIHDIVNTLNSCYTIVTNVAPETISVKWNNNNYSGVILNVDGSCLCSPLLTFCMSSSMPSIIVSCWLKTWVSLS